MAVAQAGVRKPIPFDVHHLDRLLDDAGIDVLVATSKHNVQYLLGDYKFFFFEAMDAIGVNRYLPAVIYQKGKPETAAYVGNSMEAYEKELGKFWPQSLYLSTWSGPQTMQRVVEHIGKLGPGVRRIGIEAAFLPVDAERELRGGLSNIDFVDAYFALERLRAVKSPQEIEFLKLASERVVESMNVAFGQCAPGKTKQEIAEALRVEEVKRGLAFDYCLIAAGASLNRAPSEQKLAHGDVVSIDSGGNYHGYIGDLARMAVLGEPDTELKDLLAEIEAVQRAAFAVIRPGTMGSEIYGAAERALKETSQRDNIEFLAHGMGLVSHEAPRLTASGPVQYDAADANRPLELGMVVSVETTMKHPKRGFIKLEDTIAVTATGHEMFGEAGRGWNLGGTALK